MPIPEDEFERTIIRSHKRADETPAVADPLGHYLVGGKEGAPDTRLELGVEPLTIGRDARQALVLADADVSRLHARISLTGTDASVEDLNSTNGTFLDGKRLTSPATLTDGSVLRLGSHVFRYERRSRRDVERTIGLDLELKRASNYVFSLLPAPLVSGAVLAEWCFVPSTQLGGDAFGYYWLDPNTFVFYLLDVSGHGAGSAMHSVTVLNVLRQRALPQVDFENPADVLTSLNQRFQMESHGGLYFTMWYGVYRVADRTLTYSSAGHHPASLVSIGRDHVSPLGMPAVMIGMLPDGDYQTQQAVIPPGSSIYLFSDGVFEVATADNQQWTLEQFEQLMLQPALDGIPESQRLHEGVKRVAGPKPLEDDFSLVVLTFP
ncbi:MAG: SpoIIE family protein phosphatase [Vicinamibacterales bacterium]